MATAPRSSIPVCNMPFPTLMATGSGLRCDDQGHQVDNGQYCLQCFLRNYTLVLISYHPAVAGMCCLGMC